MLKCTVETLFLGSKHVSVLPRPRSGSILLSQNLAEILKSIEEPVFVVRGIPGVEMTTDNGG